MNSIFFFTSNHFPVTVIKSLFIKLFFGKKVNQANHFEEQGNKK